MRQKNNFEKFNYWTGPLITPTMAKLSRSINSRRVYDPVNMPKVTKEEQLGGCICSKMPKRKMKGKGKKSVAEKIESQKKFLNSLKADEIGTKLLMEARKKQAEQQLKKEQQEEVLNFFKSIQRGGSTRVRF